MCGDELAEAGYLRLSRLDRCRHRRKIALNNHRDVATAVANEVIELQQALTGQQFDSAALIDGMVKAFNGDLNHQCMGRSAPGRLARALDLAEKNGLNLEMLKKISAASIQL